MSNNNQKLTTYQKLTRLFNSGMPVRSTFEIPQQELITTKSREELEFLKLQAQQNKFVRDQWQKVENDLYQKSFNYQMSRIAVYSDAENMEAFPEISSALNLYANESCLESNTKIRLLNNEELTIKELYDRNYENFWVYAVNIKTNKIEPSLVEKVIYKGKKETLKITLDDDTEIICTADHKWLNYNNEWVLSENLKPGDSLKSIYQKLNYKGYEKVSLNNFWKDFEFTHIISAEKVHGKIKEEFLKNERSKTEKIVIHHKSLNKLNNDPNELEYMFWDDHFKLHSSLTKSLWENPEHKEKMRKIASESMKKRWENPEFRINQSKKRKKYLKKYYNSLTEEERKQIYGRPGKKHNKDFNGSNNPNFYHNKKRFGDIDIKEYVDYVIEVMSKEKNPPLNKKLQKNFNLTKEGVIKYNNYICKLYNIKKIGHLIFTTNDYFKIEKIKNFILERGKEINPIRIKSEYCKKNDIKLHKLESFIKSKGYKNWSELVEKIGNHKIVKIEKHIISDVYDLLNSSVDSNFGVKCNNGMIISHNCTTNEDGKVMQIYSDSERIKSILEDLFFNRLDLNSNLYSWARNLCKLGDNFVFLKIGGEKIGVVGTIQLPNIEIEREEGDTYGAVNEEKKHTKFIWRGKNKEFNTWEIAHFRLLGKDSFLPYGTSLLSDARRYWRLLLMSEDAMCTYRVSRASERRVFKINVGNMSDEDVEQYINKIANKFKRQPIVDPRTGQVDVRFNNMDVTSDFFIPVRNDNAGTVIDTLPGACLSLETKISLLSGENISLNNLIQRWDKGERNFWVYSINPENGDILPAPITWAGITRKNTDVMKITLDNGEEIICTPDHKFPVRGKGKVESKDLKVGDSLFSFVTDKISGSINIKGIEFLEEKIDTGTITVDGNEIYSKHHTFTLSAGIFTYNSNLADIADIEYLQNKLLSSMQIPKEFIGFDSSTGEGKNLSMMDIRFARNVNRVQQALIQELNKIAIIHLYLLGFEDELSNFSLRLNNPSTQAELLKLELYRERFGLYRDATSKMENGFAMTSMTWAKKNILGMSDDEIKLDLQRQKIEAVAAQELNNITGLKTGIFDDIDRLYKSVTGIQNPQPIEGGSGGGGGFGGGGFTSSTDLGGGETSFGEETPPTEEGGFGGDLETATQEPAGETEQPTEEEQPEGETFPESIKKKNNLITEDINQMIEQINKFIK